MGRSLDTKKLIRALWLAVIYVGVLLLVTPAVFAGEPDEDVIKTAALPSSTEIVIDHANNMFMQVTSRANEIFTDLIKNGLKIKVGMTVGHKSHSRPLYKKFESVDAAAEYAFSKAYFDYNFPSKRSFASGVIEESIKNSLARERGVLAKGSLQSPLFFTSKFPRMVSRGVANYCGQNLGTDKLSHFFSDGFLMYNKIREGKLKGIHEVRQLSDLFERTSMGFDFTGVYSQADIETNVKGVEFFSRIFSSGILTVANGKLEFNSAKLNLCDYFTANLSETTHPNQYRFLSDVKKQEYIQMLQTQGAVCNKCGVQNEKLPSELVVQLNIIGTMMNHGFLERLHPRYPQRIYNSYLTYLFKPSANRTFSEIH